MILLRAVQNPALVRPRAQIEEPLANKAGTYTDGSTSPVAPSEIVDV